MTRIDDSKTVEWNLANMAGSGTGSSADPELVAKVTKTETKVASLESQVASIDTTPQTLELDGTTLKISKGNSVNLPTGGGASYDDTELKDRVSKLEAKEDKDTVYDDSDLKQRVTALESKTDKDTVYDDTEIKKRISDLETKEDKDTVYDDTELTGIKQRLINLENKPDNDKQKLTYSNGVLSIENGNSVNVPMSIGKSSYQSWLDLGNAGTEQDFIRSLKGAKGDKGDVTDIGTNALVNFTCDITSTLVPTTTQYAGYKSFSYNTKSQLGTVHLDLRPTSSTSDAHTIGNLPTGAPKPYSLIEVNVIGNKPDGTGQIYIQTDGVIRCNALIPGRRYIVDLLGYYIYR